MKPLCWFSPSRQINSLNTVIHEDIYVELLELLELYCELLIARFGLLDQKYAIVVHIRAVKSDTGSAAQGNQIRA